MNVFNVKCVLCVPVTGHKGVQQVHTPHADVVFPDHVRDADHDVGPLGPAEPLAGGAGLSRVLVGGHENSLAIFPSNKDLVLLVDCLAVPPFQRLLSHLLLCGDEGDLLQAVLPDSACACQTHFRQLPQQRK